MCCRISIPFHRCQKIPASWSGIGFLCKKGDLHTHALPTAGQRCKKPNRLLNCHIWAGSFKTDLKACSKKTNTFTLPNSYPTSMKTHKKEYISQRAHKWCLPYALALPFPSRIGFRPAFRLSYTISGLCLCRKLTADQRERQRERGWKWRGEQAFAFQRSHVTRLQPMGTLSVLWRPSPFSLNPSPVSCSVTRPAPWQHKGL